MKQNIINVSVGVVVGGLMLAGLVYFTPIKAMFGGNGTAINVPQFKVASSTTYTLTTTSQRLLATSSKRVAAQFDVTNCTVASKIHLNGMSDAAATTATGPVVFSTTTMQLSSYPYPPIMTDAVQGIAGVGTCSVVVTEWRTQY